MITIEKLNSFGADTTDGLERCFGNESLYLKLVTTIPEDSTFERLNQKIAEMVQLKYAKVLSDHAETHCCFASSYVPVLSSLICLYL